MEMTVEQAIELEMRSTVSYLDLTAEDGGGMIDEEEKGGAKEKEWEKEEEGEENEGEKGSVDEKGKGEENGNMEGLPDEDENDGKWKFVC